MENIEKFGLPEMGDYCSFWESRRPRSVNVHQTIYKNNATSLHNI